jgi:ribosomal protein S24E
MVNLREKQVAYYMSKLHLRHIQHLPTTAATTIKSQMYSTTQHSMLFERMLLHDRNRDQHRLNRVVYDICEETIPVSMGNGASVHTRTRGVLEVQREAKDNETLLFESRYESMNLQRAIQISDYEYDLILNNDHGTTGHTQWFYFSVSNMKKNQSYKFNIVNMLKSDSLFNYGMSPVVYSTRDAEEKQIGWIRNCFDVCYYQNTRKREENANSKEPSYFHTLTFSYKCHRNNDVVYFAYSYPYTYSDLQSHLSMFERKRNIVKRESLCQSLAGKRIDMLTITNFDSDKLQIEKRKGVIFSARVHPGEVSASWIAKGILDFLTSDEPEANALRDLFVFKIVPMLNPDGVIAGNYRCSLSGDDLNRKYDNPDQELHRPIYYMKKLVKDFKAERDIVLFTDLHAHSRKKNIFMYGCTSTDYEKQIDIKVFPKLLSEISPYFSFQDCSFNLSKARSTSGRVVVYKELGISNSFTMEASLCGAGIGPYSGCQFSVMDLETMGKNLCQGLLVYVTNSNRVNRIRQDLCDMFPENLSINNIENIETQFGTGSTIIKNEIFQRKKSKKKEPNARLKSSVVNLIEKGTGIKKEKHNFMTSSNNIIMAKKDISLLTYGLITCLFILLFLCTLFAI